MGSARLNKKKGTIIERNGSRLRHDGNKGGGKRVTQEKIGGDVGAGEKSKKE